MVEKVVKKIGPCPASIKGLAPDGSPQFKGWLPFNQTNRRKFSQKVKILSFVSLLFLGNMCN
jgi:hypothetical protein